MAAYTLLEYKKGLKLALGMPPNAQLLTDLMIINGALKDVVYAHPWAWRQKYLSFTTDVDGEASFTDAGILVLHAHTTAVGITGNRMLEEVAKLGAGQPLRSHSTYRYMLTTATQANATSRPTQEIKIFPLPTVGAAFEGIALRTIPDLSADTDIADVPLRYDELIMLRVRYKGRKHYAMDAADDLACYMDMLQRFISEDANNQSNLNPSSGVLGVTAQAAST
jgi:hypothetical protein